MILLKHYQIIKLAKVFFETEHTHFLSIYFGDFGVTWYKTCFRFRVGLLGGGGLGVGGGLGGASGSSIEVDGSSMASDRFGQHWSLALLISISRTASKRFFLVWLMPSDLACNLAFLISNSWLRM